MTFPPYDKPYIDTDLQDATDSAGSAVSDRLARILTLACMASFAAYVLASEPVRAWWAEIARLASKYTGVGA